METTEKVVHRPGNNKKPIENKKKPIVNHKKIIVIVGGYLQVNPASIIKCVTENHHVIIHLADNPTVLRVTQSLDQICEEYAEYDFIQINKSHVINMNHMLTYMKEGGGTIVMIDGSTLYLGSDIYRKAFFDWLDQRKQAG